MSLTSPVAPRHQAALGRHLPAPRAQAGSGAALVAPAQRGAVLGLQRRANAPGWIRHQRPREVGVSDGVCALSWSRRRWQG